MRPPPGLPRATRRARPRSSAGVEAGAPDTSARTPGKCPEPTEPDRVVAFDWSKELGVDAPLAARLRGVSGTAVETRLLAAQVDAELRAACAGIAAELGVKGSFASAPVACQAAVDGLKAQRAKLLKPAKVAVHVHPAFCPEPIDDVKECAKRCSGQDQAPDATCAGATVGRCPGTCDGACELRAPSVCDGTCLGNCEGGFTGTCEGTCKGKCDGIEVKPTGECKGKCEGACDAVAKGECKGRCSGGCQLHAAACAGVCAGRCSVAVQAPECLGTVKLAATSAECGSYCELRAMHRSACGAALVDVRVDGPQGPGGGHLCDHHRAAPARRAQGRAAAQGPPRRAEPGEGCRGRGAQGDHRGRRSGGAHALVVPLRLRQGHGGGRDQPPPERPIRRARWWPPPG